MLIPQRLNLKQIKDILICQKPQGVTPRPNKSHQPSFTSWIEEKLKTTIHACNYLDIDLNTSGLITYTLTGEKEKELIEAWKSQSIVHNYVFITDQTSQLTEIVIETKPTFETQKSKENKNTFFSETKSSKSKTQFVFLKNFKNYSLWQATTSTSNCQQVRTHAKAAQIPILGDKENGGGIFFRLCLHSISLQIPGYEPFTSHPPKYFDDLSLIEDDFTCKLEDAYHRRNMVYLIDHAANSESIRILHHEIDLVKIDIYANQWWVYDYGITEVQKTKLISFVNSKGKPPYFIREMKNRGQTPDEGLLTEGNKPLTQWLAKENAMTFEMRSNQGMSPGLFLDQRENRKWIFENAKEKSVLNLFSYTGGFSVAAALGKAKSVTTVDLSKTFIDWSKRNFELNDLKTKDYEFWAADSRTFIDGCIKRNKTFDLIICDPPSFSRGKNGVFRIDKDVSELIQAIWKILTKDGILLFCTNYEKWDLKQLKENINLLKQQDVKLLVPPLLGLDFELPNERPLMKTLLLQKKGK
jgi:23S rRNA (cytosine1962-C5)-methyltransferase